MLWFGESLFFPSFIRSHHSLGRALGWGGEEPLVQQLFTGGGSCPGHYCECWGCRDEQNTKSPALEELTFW